MFCAGKPAWHGLGVNIKENCNAETAIDLSGLNWNVEKLQLFNPVTQEPIQSWGTFRSDNHTFLGNIGKDYMPIQNIRMFDTLDVLIGEINGSHYESAGALGVGEKVWALAKLPQKIMVGDDISENYVLFANSHNGSSYASVKLTSTRVVCQNTLNIALQDAGKLFKIQHSENCNIRIDQVQKTVGSVSEQIKGLNDMFNAFNGKVITRKEFDDVLRALFPIKSEEESSMLKAKKELVENIFEYNDGNAFPEQRGTAYNLLNSVTKFVDHHQKLQKSDDIDKKRKINAMFGLGEVLKLQALMEIGKIVGINTKF